MFNLPHSGIKLNLQKEPALSNPFFRIDVPKTAFLPLKIGSKDFYPEGLKIGSEIQRGQILAYARDDRELRLISPFDGIFDGIIEKKHPYYRRVNCIQITVLGGGEESAQQEELSRADANVDTLEEASAAFVSKENNSDKALENVKETEANVEPTVTDDDKKTEDTQANADNAAKSIGYDFTDMSLPEMSINQLVKMAKLAGITDEIDGTFLYEKLEIINDEKYTAIALSSLDSQPYISSGTAVLLKYMKEVCGGMQLLSNAMGGVSRHIIMYGEECSKKIDNTIGDIKVIKLTGNYPFTPNLPEKTFIMGIQAAKALYEACAEERLNFRQMITVSGSAVEHPQNIEAETGTPIIELIEHCSLKSKPGRIIVNDVMLGQAMSASSVVFPGLSAITVLSGKETRHATACIGCGRCVNICPQKIMPCYILRDYQNENINGADFRRSKKCIGCGLCSYVCPSGINLCKIVGKSANILYKAELYNKKMSTNGKGSSE